MFVNFNIDKLNKLLFDFHRLTGLTISIWDSEFNQLSYQPIEMCSFCKLIKQSNTGRNRCFQNDRTLCMQAAELGVPTTHFCHAGLVDTAIPIKFKDSIMGYIMFGQVTSNIENDMLEKIKNLSKALDINYSDLQNAYNMLDTYDDAKINAAANILKMATRYLWLSEYIEIGYNTLASQIDDYIRQHLSDNISIQNLCSYFGISKNKLYETSHDWFKMPIGDYITSHRITEAKRLLTTTDLPIYEISIIVGIKDYNYFTKFFKSKVGISPLKYRKGFPFNLHDEKSQLEMN